jgi:phage-related protein (TIGR01555 family)
MDLFNDGVLGQVFGSISNKLSGFGSSRDPNSQTQINPSPRFSEKQLENLFRTSRVIEKAVLTIPYDATVKPPQLEIDNDLKLAEQIEVEIRKFDFLKLAMDAWERGRLYGEGYLVLDVNDGNDYNEPLDFNKIRSIDNIKVSDCTEILPYNVSIRGNFEYYQIINHEHLYSQDKIMNSFSFIHKSRVIKFPGKPLFGEMLVDNDGHSDSIVVGLFNEFVSWYTSLNSGSNMLASHSLFTYRMKGLRQLTKTQDREGLYNRFSTLMQGMSSLKGLVLDADGEDAEFINRNYGGVQEIISELKENLASASGLPYTLLWGTPTGGAFSESGASDRYEHARNITQQQNRILRPALNYFTKILFAIGKKQDVDFEWHFPSVLQLTDKEQAELQKLYAEADQIRLRDKILHPMEIRQSRYGQPELGANIETQEEYEEELNLELEQKREQQQKMMEMQNQTNQEENSQEDSFQDKFDGDILPQSEYDKMAEITEQDKKETIDQFKKEANNKWKNILQAE